MVNKLDCSNDFKNSIGLLASVTNSDTATCNERIKALNELHQVLKKYAQGRSLLEIGSGAHMIDMCLIDLSLDPKYLPILEEVTRVRKALIPYFSVAPMPNVELSLGFFCEIDAPDHNGVCKRAMMNFFNNKLPILTTTSLLRGLDRDQRGILFNLQHDWHILKQVGSGFVLFLPKNIKPELDLTSKLTELDFNPQALESTRLASLLGSRPSEADIQHLKQIFLEGAQTDKLFYLEGHGDSNSVAGMEMSNYLQLLKLIDEQRCKGLVISTCFGGGKNSLHLQGKSYPVFLRSIGDFISFGDEPAQECSADFNQALVQQLSKGPLTLAAFQKMVERVEQGRSKDLMNHIQMIFPHSQEIPAGFRPLSEQGKVASITQVQLKQAMMKKELVIHVRKKSVLGLYPLAIEKTLSFCLSDPVLISMVPGPSHHFIETIMSDEAKPSEYFQKMINFHSKINDSKGFFIGTFDHEDELWTNVSLLINSSGHELVYMCNEKYYYQSRAGTKEIDWVTHAEKVAVMEALTLPSAEAIRLSSGGQESENDFKAAIDHYFWSENGRKLIKTLIFADNVKEDSMDLESGSVSQFLKDIIAHFAKGTDLKKVSIRELKNSLGGFKDLFILLCGSGCCVYRRGKAYFLLSQGHTHNISEEEYFKYAEQMITFTGK